MSEQTPDKSRKILVGEDKKVRAGAPDLVGASLWPMLTIAGIALLAVGLSDLGLAWYPPAFGNREWEFGTVTAILNGMPVVLMGTVFVYLGAANRDMVRFTKVIGILSALGALIIVVLAAIYLTNVPLALQSVEGPILTGVKKAIVKTVIQSVVYPLTFGYLGWRAFRHFRPAETT